MPKNRKLPKIQKSSMFSENMVKNVNFMLQMLFRVSSLVGIVMLAILLERECFMNN